MNGTDCAYEHSAQGVLSLAQHAAEPESVTPMPTGGTNHIEYGRTQDKQADLRGPRDHTAGLHTSYRTPVYPRSPLAATQSEALKLQGATVDCLLNLINSPTSRSQTFSPNRHNDHISTISSSSWWEPVTRGGQRSANAQPGDFSRHPVPHDSFSGFSNVGPRLWRSRPESREAQPRVEHSQDILDTVALDRGEDSSDSSFRSAVCVNIALRDSIHLS